MRYAEDELLAILALESDRAKAYIVGEDLGTVEENFRKQLKNSRVLSYRLIWFENVPPASFPKQALAAVTTHDLPTIAGLWTGSDLRAQRELGLSPNEEGMNQISEPALRDVWAFRRKLQSRKSSDERTSCLPSAVKDPERDLGGCAGGGGATQHAGHNEQTVAQLVARVAKISRRAGATRLGTGDRAGAQTR